MNIEKNATTLSKNPLGIIALFILLIYGFATLLFGTIGSSLSPNQKWCFVIFLISFPVIVLFVFTFLVIKHHQKLYAPSDYKNEEHFFGHSSANEIDKQHENDVEEQNHSPDSSNTDKEENRKKRIEEREKVKRLENLVYEYYEKTFNYDIDKNIFYKIGNRKILFNGQFIKNDTITFLKIKYLPNKFISTSLINMYVLDALRVKDFLVTNNTYQNYKFLLTFVIDSDDVNEKADFRTMIQDMININSIYTDIKILSIKQLENC